ncbi:MAG: hypothetical protein AB1758_03315 [Candidatus Eremiobacterota bacterium]
MTGFASVNPNSLPYAPYGAPDWLSGPPVPGYVPVARPLGLESQAHGLLQALIESSTHGSCFEPEDGRRYLANLEREVQEAVGDPDFHLLPEYQAEVDAVMASLASRDAATVNAALRRLVDRLNRDLDQRYGGQFEMDFTPLVGGDTVDPESIRQWIQQHVTEDFIRQHSTPGDPNGWMREIYRIFSAQTPNPVDVVRGDRDGDGDPVDSEDLLRAMSFATFATDPATNRPRYTIIQNAQQALLDRLAANGVEILASVHVDQPSTQNAVAWDLSVKVQNMLARLGLDSSYSFQLPNHPDTRGIYQRIGQIARMNDEDARNAAFADVLQELNAVLAARWPGAEPIVHQPDWRPLRSGDGGGNRFIMVRTEDLLANLDGLGLRWEPGQPSPQASLLDRPGLDRSGDGKIAVRFRAHQSLEEFLSQSQGPMISRDWEAYREFLPFLPKADMDRYNGLPPDHWSGHYDNANGLDYQLGVPMHYPHFDVDLDDDGRFEEDVVRTVRESDLGLDFNGDGVIDDTLVTLRERGNVNPAFMNSIIYFNGTTGDGRLSVGHTDLEYPFWAALPETLPCQEPTFHATFEPECEPPEEPPVEPPPCEPPEAPPVEPPPCEPPVTPPVEPPYEPPVVVVPPPVQPPVAVVPPPAQPPVAVSPPAVTPTPVPPAAVPPVASQPVVPVVPPDRPEASIEGDPHVRVDIDRDGDLDYLFDLHVPGQATNVLVYGNTSVDVHSEVYSNGFTYARQVDVHVGGQEVQFRVDGANQMQISTDGGRTWTAAQPGDRIELDNGAVLTVGTEQLYPTTNPQTVAVITESDGTTTTVVQAPRQVSGATSDNLNVTVDTERTITAGHNTTTGVGDPNRTYTAVANDPAVRQAEQELAAARRDRDAKKSACDQARTAVGRAQNELREINRSITETTRARDSAQSQLDELERPNRGDYDCQSDYLAALSAYNQRRRELTERVQDLNDRLKALTAEKVEAEKRLADAQRELSQKQQALRDAEAAVTRAQTALDNAVRAARERAPGNAPVDQTGPQ